MDIAQYVFEYGANGWNYRKLIILTFADTHLNCFNFL